MHPLNRTLEGIRQSYSDSLFFNATGYEFIGNNDSYLLVWKIDEKETISEFINQSNLKLLEGFSIPILNQKVLWLFGTYNPVPIKSSLNHDLDINGNLLLSSDNKENNDESDTKNENNIDYFNDDENPDNDFLFIDQHTLKPYCIDQVTHIIEREELNKINGIPVTIPRKPQTSSVNLPFLCSTCGGMSDDEILIKCTYCKRVCHQFCADYYYNCCYCSYFKELQDTIFDLLSNKTEAGDVIPISIECIPEKCLPYILSPHVIGGNPLFLGKSNNETVRNEENNNNISLISKQTLVDGNENTNNKSNNVINNNSNTSDNNSLDSMLDFTNSKIPKDQLLFESKMSKLLEPLYTEPGKFKEVSIKFGSENKQHERRFDCFHYRSNIVNTKTKSRREYVEIDDSLPLIYRWELKGVITWNVPDKTVSSYYLIKYRLNNFYKNHYR